MKYRKARSRWYVHKLDTGSRFRMSTRHQAERVIAALNKRGVSAKLEIGCVIHVNIRTGNRV